VRPQKIAKLFVISDISTFLMQVRINILNWVCVSVDAHEINFLKGWRKWPCGKQENDECRGKGHSRGPCPSIRFLWLLLCSLGQESHQHQVGSCILNIRLLQSAYLGVIHFFRLNFRTPAFILATIVTIKPHIDSFYLSYYRICSGNRWLPPHTRRQVPRSVCSLSIMSAYRRYSFPLRPGCITSGPGDCHLHSLVANQVYQAREGRGSGDGYGIPCLNSRF